MNDQRRSEVLLTKEEIRKLRLCFRRLRDGKATKGSVREVSQELGKLLRVMRSQRSPNNEPVALHAYSYYRGIDMALAEIERALTDAPE